MTTRWNKYSTAEQRANRRINYRKLVKEKTTNYQKFRREPIFWIGKRWNGRAFRKIRTWQEIKYFVGQKIENRNNEYKIKIRNKRCKSNIPTAWDDLPVSSRKDRCWKNYRKQQWKTRN